MAQFGQLSNAAETVDLFTKIEENNPKKNRIKIVPRESRNYKSYIRTRNVFVHMKIIIGQIQNFSNEICQYWLILKKLIGRPLICSLCKSISYGIYGI